LAFKAGSTQYRIAEKALFIFVNILCSLRINKLPFISESSQKVFSFLWHTPILQPFLDFSPLRKFIDQCQVQYPLGKVSNTCISVVIPCHPKDSALLSVVLEGLERNSLNNISEVIIVSPENLEINHFTKLNLRFINDSQVVSSELFKLIKRNFPTSQFGWVLQQIIKIETAMKLSQNENTLVIDSDTVITKPTLFVDGNRQILNITREYHRQYIKQYQDFSKINFDLGLSFVTHYQVWQRDILEGLWGEDRLNEWLRCADKSSQSSMSEYQSYGSHLVEKHPQRFEFAQWGNIEISRALVKDLSYEAATNTLPDAQSISIHSYS
jgi:hypothetical protein